MPKFKCVIIDDEVQCVNILQKIIEKYLKDELEIIGTFTNPIEALKFINTNKFDILFCDVEMPKLTGLDLVNTLEENLHQIVFTTAHTQYAINAIKASVVDYLVKPFGQEEVLLAFEKCKKKLDLLSRKSNTSAENLTFSIHVQNGVLQFIDSKDVVYIESQSNYSHITLQDKSKFVIAKTLKEFDEMLVPYGFFRVHHSYLVNLKYIQMFKGGNDDSLLLKTGDVIYVSRRRKQEFLETMKK